MQKIKEDFLYYIWKTKQFDTSDLKSLTGERIEVLDFGIQNMNSGPDFSNGKVKIGDTVWAGNIEMHIFSSDWTLHKHQKDDAYKNVILHVVYEHDKDIVFNTESPQLAIPTLELKKYIAPSILNVYRSLIESELWIPCENLIGGIDQSVFGLWKYNLTIQRLWTKTNYIDDLLTLYKDDWEEIFYIVLSRYFGATANTLAFEQLALSCSVKNIYKNRHEPLIIESLLFGQAGFLQADFEEDYFQALKKEYAYQAKKYGLIPLQVSNFKFGRMMPPGFPTFRIAQLAALLAKNEHFFSKIIEVNTLEDLYPMFDIEPHEFWEEHYLFHKPSKSHSGKLSKPFIDRLIINCVVPLTFLYGQRNGKEAMIDKSISFLEALPSESNSVLTKWKELGFKSENAFDSQSLLHLKKHYCDAKNCMQCSIGHKLMKDA